MHLSKDTIIKILDSNGHLPFFFQSNEIYGLILSAAIFPELNTFLKSHFFSKANFLNNNNRKRGINAISLLAHSAERRRLRGMKNADKIPRMRETSFPLGDDICFELRMKHL